MDECIEALRSERNRRASFEETRPAGILIVSHRPRRLEMFADFLEDCGFAVWPVGTGLSALGTYASHRGDIDLLMLDVDLHDLPGPAFLKRLRRYDQGVPCLLVADGSNDHLVAESCAFGAAVLTWPMPLNRLCERLWDELEGNLMLGSSMSPP